MYYQATCINSTTYMLSTYNGAGCTGTAAGVNYMTMEPVCTLQTGDGGPPTYQMQSCSSGSVPAITRGIVSSINLNNTQTTCTTNAAYVTQNFPTLNTCINLGSGSAR
jgi:hypothetical protein